MLLKSNFRINIRIFYSNIYKNNNNISEFEEKAKTKNPNILHKKIIYNMHLLYLIFCYRFVLNAKIHFDFFNICILYMYLNI